MLRPLFFLVLYSLSFLVAPFAIANPSSDSLKGALCIVRVDDKIVLVHEVLTDRISLPGGTIIEGESPQLAAQRETWEETGLVVTVGEELGRTDTAIFYDCASDSDVIAFSMENALGANELPTWFAPHYGVEIASAMLLPPNELIASLYRYPSQWNDILRFYNDATDQSVVYVNQLIESAPSFRQLELTWMVDLQTWASSFSENSRATACEIAKLVTGLTNPTFLLFLFPFVMMRFGIGFVYRLFFALTATSLMVLVAQQGFALPRPHVYTPIAELTHSFGFSFPSLPIAIWSCVVTFIFQKTQRFGINRETLCVSVVTLFVMACKFFLGTAFILDMMIGAVLGVLVAWHVLRLEAKPDINVDQLLSSKGVWFTMTIITAVLSILWPLPVFVSWLAIIITTSALVLAFKNTSARFDRRQMLFVILVLLLVDQLYLYSVSMVSFSGFWSLVFKTLHYPILMLLFMTLAKKLTRDNRTE
ncbi:bifunctional NUDIX hydrolase/phosphatase PAP2 family protein [Vibrio sp. PID17_43]|uniref:bifunctional NUDIX hydrolase/phosphatase PAP2 family protein n=1 Tax=unclassified Vibrio TaxID=2614977 RepID=UPI000BFFBA92|nr:bifunctional NUDIX hydrolase/phosphatase PAP2 family protein [Vibrio sp. PID17_43]PHJ40057.1 DNA mismatch repair protein MutT [Vibrio sp. PID17_43]